MLQIRISLRHYRLHLIMPSQELPPRLPFLGRHCSDKAHPPRMHPLLLDLDLVCVVDLRR